ncbi:MAG: hypothetical protein O4861_01855 [Trichodesmium sp. St16_bin4-tuft]|nr:hypothetical protein [Trichodesmium sp. MAG_R01]MDE5078329.1 hypothetical protein [Trichodesmium sp. St2_bin6]MDE5097150.1 hypothetical protein [Trichodesmium sp. St16_bin4-tuft]MDE5104068.1 hypothetical protein [Trichodesmium sp. St19_bin2]
MSNGLSFHLKQALTIINGIQTRGEKKNYSTESFTADFAQMMYRFNSENHVVRESYPGSCTIKQRKAL